MEKANYALALPMQPREKSKLWAAEKSGSESDHLLLYKSGAFREPMTGTKCKAAELWCSACGESMFAAKIEAQCCCNSYATAPIGWMHPVEDEPVISGEKSTCPNCGAPVKVEFARDCRRVVWDLKEYWFMEVERIGEKLALIGWVMKKEAVRDRGTGRLTEQVRYLPYQAYVFEGKKTVLLRGYDKYFSQLHFHEQWEQRDRCMDEYGKVGNFGVAPWDKKLLIGSNCENSKLDLYLKIAKGDAVPVTYLRLWQKKKAVENLLVQGAGALLQELILREAYSTYSGWCRSIPKLEGIDWKEKRPAQMLGLTKEEFRCCVDSQWDRMMWEFFRGCKKLGIQLKLPEELETCVNAGTYELMAMAKEGHPVAPAARYLAKQGQRAHYLRDYWRMAEGEGYDLRLRQVRWPKDLKAAHDRVMNERAERQKRERDEKEQEKNRRLREAFAGIAEKLHWMCRTEDGISIRVCFAPEELDAEGRTLNHCVATYKDKHARGDSAIFFVRRAKDRDKPWYTLELDLKELRVIQNRGKANCARTPEVEAFEAKWLEFVKANWAANMTKKKRRKTA